MYFLLCSNPECRKPCLPAQSGGFWNVCFSRNLLSRENHNFCFTHLGFLYLREPVLILLRSRKKQLTISLAQVKRKLGSLYKGTMVKNSSLSRASWALGKRREQSNTFVWQTFLSHAVPSLSHVTPSLPRVINMGSESLNPAVLRRAEEHIYSVLR